MIPQIKDELLNSPPRAEIETNRRIFLIEIATDQRRIALNGSQGAGLGRASCFFALTTFQELHEEKKEGNEDENCKRED